MRYIISRFTYILTYVSYSLGVSSTTSQSVSQWHCCCCCWCCMCAYVGTTQTSRRVIYDRLAPIHSVGRPRLPTLSGWKMPHVTCLTAKWPQKCQNFHGAIYDEIGVVRHAEHAFRHGVSSYITIRYDTIRYIICTEKLTGKLPV